MCIFSGHYQTYGLNIQAACNHNCCFVFVGIAGLKVMGDCKALFENELGDMIEGLPGLYCVIGDCAYKPTKHLVSIFGGLQGKNKHNDNFNYYASQLCICIEMAFGLMINKWAILRQPLTNKIQSIKKIVMGIAHLHNSCINERLLTTNSNTITPCNVELSPYEQSLRATAATIQFEHLNANFDNTHSNNRV